MTSLLSKPWIIALALASVFIFALSNTIVKITALKNPLHSEAKSVHKDVEINKLEIKHPDGTIETRTITKDLSRLDSKKDEKPNLVDAKLLSFGVQGGYDVLSGTWHGGIFGGIGPIEVGVSNPVALEFKPRVDCRLVLLRR